MGEPQGDATAHLRVTVKDRDRAKVDRAFSNAVIELYVAGYPGFYTTTSPASAVSRHSRRPWRRTPASPVCWRATHCEASAC